MIETLRTVLSSKFPLKVSIENILMILALAALIRGIRTSSLILSSFSHIFLILWSIGLLHLIS